MAASPTPPAWRIGFDRADRLKAALVAVAFFAVFWNLLDFWGFDGFGNLVHYWVYQPDWSHGPIIPAFSAYLVYLHWDRVRRCKVEQTWIGLVVLCVGLAVYAWTWFGLTFDYARPVSMLLTLLGVALFLCGAPVFRYIWLPWLYLFFAIPIPQRLYFEITDPLRKLSAAVAAAVLGLIPDFSIERVGSNLHYLYQGQSGAIGVADACSGMRSTVTLCALGVAVAFLSPRPAWQRLLMVGSCVPIATFCNFIRVSLTCWLHIFVDPKYATGTYHTVLGLVMLLLAFMIFSGLGWLLANLVVETDEPDEPDTPTPSAQAGTA